jgi:hypothetical protein
MNWLRVGKLSAALAVTLLSVGWTMAAEHAGKSQKGKPSGGNGAGVERNKFSKQGDSGRKEYVRKPDKPKPSKNEWLKDVGGRDQKHFEAKLLKKHNGKRRAIKGRTYSKNYHKKHGKRFRYHAGDKVKRGWYYPGRAHRHWKYCTWNTHYKRWFFFDECTTRFYYFCHKHKCYLPIDCGCSLCCESTEDEETPPCYVDSDEDDDRRGGQGDDDDDDDDDDD